MKGTKSPIDMEFNWYHAFKRNEDTDENFIRNYNSYTDTLKVPEPKSLETLISGIASNLIKPEYGWDITIISRGNLKTADAVTLFTLLDKIEEIGKKSIVITPELPDISIKLRLRYKNTQFISQSEMYSLTKYNTRDRTNSTHILYALICYLKINTLCNHFVQWGFHVGVFYLANLLETHFEEKILSWHTCKYNYKPKSSGLKKISTGVMQPGYVYYPILFPKLTGRKSRSLDFSKRAQIITKNKFTDPIKYLLMAKKDGFILASSMARSEKIKNEAFMDSVISITNSNKKIIYIIFESNQNSKLIENFTKKSPRIVIVPQFDSSDLDHIFNIIDLYLDPFPFSGGHSLYRALQLGVPTISMGGNKLVTYNSLCKKLSTLLEKDTTGMQPFNPLSAKFGIKSYIQKANNIIYLLQNDKHTLQSMVKTIQAAVINLESQEIDKELLEWLGIV